MDPNATLSQLRRVVARIHDNDATPRDPETAAMLQDADLLATLFDSLDEWISRGGFLPEGWKVANR